MGLVKKADEESKKASVKRAQIRVEMSTCFVDNETSPLEAQLRRIHDMKELSEARNEKDKGSL